MQTEMSALSFHDGAEPTLEKGKINANRQSNRGTLGVLGTVSDSLAFKMKCLLCGFVYGANSGEVLEHACPNCQGGAPGIRFWLDASSAQAGTNGSHSGFEGIGHENETAGDWVDRASGTFKDDPDFAEMVRLGREFRECHGVEDGIGDDGG